LKDNIYSARVKNLFTGSTSVNNARRTLVLCDIMLLKPVPMTLGAADLAIGMLVIVKVTMSLTVTEKNRVVTVADLTTSNPRPDLLKDGVAMSIGEVGIGKLQRQALSCSFNANYMTI
jgi:hypothetical protein